jgi:hypothetical protein
MLSLNMHKAKNALNSAWKLSIRIIDAMLYIL